MSPYKEEDLSKIKSISIGDRKSKVSVGDFVDPATLRRVDGEALLEGFPRVLKGDELRRFVSALEAARRDKREIVWLIGAHVIKCGLSLYINSLIDRGYVTALATTGSATVHDLELAFYGVTSEDVAEELPQGRFGMSRETAAHFEAACRLAAESDRGLGEGVGAYVNLEKAPYEKISVFGHCQRAGVPATVHVALGTDITHQHPTFPAAMVGELSMRDFRIHAGSVGRLFDNGVAVVLGSAVVLPEVFMKAVSVSYSVGRKPENVTAASFDMLPQYRVGENVLRRPFPGSGQSYAFTGHHELMLPVLYHLLEG